MRSLTISTTRRRLAVVALLAVPLALVGCKQFILLGYLIGGPPTITPEFEAATGESFTDYDVRVAVICYAEDRLKWDFHAIDRELEKFIAFRFVDHHVQIIHPDRVTAWRDRNPDWERAPEVGAGVGADYVVSVELVNYNLFEENSQHLFRGRAEALVSCWSVDENGDGKEVFKQDVLSKYPTRQPRSTSDISYEAFKAEYLQRLSDEIGRLFYPHALADDIGVAG